MRRQAKFDAVKNKIYCKYPKHTKYINAISKFCYDNNIEKDRRPINLIKSDVTTGLVGMGIGWLLTIIFSTIIQQIIIHYLQELLNREN